MISDELHQKIVETMEVLKKISDEGILPVSYLWPIDIDEDLTDDTWLELVERYNSYVNFAGDNDLRDRVLEIYEEEN